MIQFEKQEKIYRLLKDDGMESEKLDGKYRVMTEEAEMLIKKIEFLAKDMKQLIRAVSYTDRTYEKICNLTYNENQGGQLRYSLGHAGLGVAFSSGLGDRHLPCGRLEALPEQKTKKNNPPRTAAVA
ncbi:hypothetical protein [Brevibacillus parabrevis]|uniref:hypothetical protein n=1 Tax=Brevibacillus parabrevis TaxID=54914 RepID=UPI002E246F89|nr:hypothetical protein [Brevibacillus parabrevis]